MILQIISLLVLLITAPAGLIYLLWKKQEPTRFEWLTKTLYTGVFLLYSSVVGRWDWLSVYLRWVWVSLFLIVAALSYRTVREAPFFSGGGERLNWKRASGYLFTLAVFLVFLGFSLRGYFFSAESVHLAFPLKGGIYYVGQGGNSPLVNYHNRSRTQKYALDIVALNQAGTRASGLYPSDVERYVIFGDIIYSPCDGEVVEAIDGLQDQSPPQTDSANPAGNHLVIACDGADVLLAHLGFNSLLVGQGEQVKAGDRVGRVGNSGNTSEPHLHIHATRPGSGGAMNGTGIPMLFDDRFLVRNSIVE